MLVVIGYDTPSNRRRRRIDKTLCGYGERVQESLFECWLDQTRYTALKQKLAAIIQYEEDHIRYYRLCHRDVAAVRVAGTGNPPRETVTVIL